MSILKSGGLAAKQKGGGNEFHILQRKVVAGREAWNVIPVKFPPHEKKGE